MAENKSQTTLIEVVVGAAALTGVGWALWHFSGCATPGEQPRRPSGTGTALVARRPLKADFADGGSGTPLEQADPVADAKARVQRFELKRAEVAALLENALAERDELVVTLREAGVTQAADLRDNSRGQGLAGSLAKVGAEIEGLERQLAGIDGAILDAQAVVRRLEREQAGISDEEKAKLAEQLRQAEERTDGAAEPVTLLGVEAALNLALKGPSASAKKTAPGPAASKLVGRWEHHHSADGSTYSLEFTTGDTAILKRYALEVVGTYALRGNTLTLTDGDGQDVAYSLEFRSVKEVLFRAHGRKGQYGSFDGLTGRWSKK